MNHPLYEFSYNKLWKLLIDLKWKKKDLQKSAKLGSAVIAKMGRGESVNLETPAKFALLSIAVFQILLKLSQWRNNICLILQKRKSSVLL